eukprot:5579458-Pyramimonas_sp.AAC.1
MSPSARPGGSVTVTPRRAKTALPPWVPLSEVVEATAVPHTPWYPRISTRLCKAAALSGPA